MTPPPDRTSIWLAVEPDPVFTVLHGDERGSRSRSAVLLCPPFGWDEMCSYRGRRAWADELALGGYPTARIDLPGTGDSGGAPQDPARMSAWIDAVAQAAAWLRERTGAERVVGAGIGLGGMLVCAALADGAPIDDLVLWAVPSRGRTLLRELRAQAAVIGDRHPDDARPSEPTAGGGLELAGFLLSAETAAALERFDLTSATCDGHGRRALLFGRETLAPDKRLRKYLEDSGFAVQSADGAGFDALMSPPQESRPPSDVIARTVAWLGEAPAAPGERGRGVAPRELQAARIGDLQEAPITVRYRGTELAGILASPASAQRASVCAVLLNSGAMRRIGPNRMWVEIARRWAAAGVPTVRLDLAGIGDSDGDSSGYVRNSGLYATELIEQTRGVVAELATRELPSRFVLVGLCSGAHWALHTAVADSRVAAALMVNLYPIFWTPDLIEEQETRHVISSLRGRGWRRIARRDFQLDDLTRALRSLRPRRILAGRRGSAEGGQRADVDGVLNGLRDNGAQGLILLGKDEPLYDQFERQGQLERLGDWPNLTLDRIPSADHSLRALWLQQMVHERLDAALERVLGGVAAPSA